MKKLRSVLVLGVTASFVLAIGVAGGTAAKGTAPAPTGQRAHGQSLLEPVFNAENPGELGYVNTPDGTQHPVPSNPNSWSPIYIVEYPTGSTIVTSGSGASGPLNCWHSPTDNCPTHGPGIALLAASAMPGVYGAGAIGHDHVMDFPGGADWNVAWEPVAVLFTNVFAANTRLLTDSAIDAAVASGNAIEIPLPTKTFHCSLVSDQVWSLSTPFG